MGSVVYKVYFPSKKRRSTEKYTCYVNETLEKAFDRIAIVGRTRKRVKDRDKIGVMEIRLSQSERFLSPSIVSHCQADSHLLKKKNQLPSKNQSECNHLSEHRSNFIHSPHPLLLITSVKHKSCQSKTIFITMSKTTIRLYQVFCACFSRNYLS